MGRSSLLLSILAPALALALAACSSPTGEGSATAEPTLDQQVAAQEVAIDTAKLEATDGVAYLAGGCFWGVEHFLEQIDGVLRVESGYMGGHVDDPSYAEVTSHDSGHLETVRVYFDPERVSYEAVVKRFFEIHDPTQVDGQGPDIGSQYLSAVFVASPEQREVTEGLIERLEARGYDVATEVRPNATFWAAEDYHQDYYAKHDKTPYCHSPVDRFGD